MSTSWSQRPLLLELSTPPSRGHDVVGRTWERCERGAAFEAAWPREGEGDGLVARATLPLFLMKTKPEAVFSSPSSEELGGLATLSGARLAIFAFAASLSRSSLLRQTNKLSAGKTQERTSYISRVTTLISKVRGKRCTGVTL